MRGTDRVASAPGHSLGRRLSAWLALQGLLAAFAVSAVVYAVNSWVLHRRQVEELQFKQGVVRHALAETSAAGDAVELRHRLDDFLAGHRDMGVSVVGQEGNDVYRSASSPPERGEPRRLLTRWSDSWPAGPSGHVAVELTLDVSRDDDLLRLLGMSLFGASLFGAAVVSVSGYFLVRRGLRPVRELSAQVATVALDRPSLRLDGSGQPLELQPLVDRFNALLARVERSYVQLEAFNADVAHELRTPLTTLIGASEVALQRARPVEELQDVIAANLDDLRRLAAIVNDMLFLSQADRGAQARRSSVVSLSSAMDDIVDYHDAAFHERNLTISRQGDAAGAFDVGLLRRALSNLLSNAARYALGGSEVVVRIEVRGSRLLFGVENVGEPIGRDHLPHLFDRFYRADRSRRKAGANFGLGLAIVAAIARMHGGEPYVRSASGKTAIGIDIPLGESDQGAAGGAAVRPALNDPETHG